MVWSRAIAAALVALLAVQLLPYTGEGRRAPAAAPWAVVAGASEGLGAAWAQHLAARGYKLVLIARSAEKLEAVAARLRPVTEVELVVADLVAMTEQDVRERVLADRGVDALVFNAAFTASGAFLDTPLAAKHQVLDLNTRALVTFTYVLAGPMRERGGGAVVLLSSLTGLIGTPHYTTYAATKGFINILASGLWFELSSHGVHALSCVVGATRTPNYLSATAMPPLGLSFLEQAPEDVVDECWSALGRTSSMITGFWNKLTFKLFMEWIPHDWAVLILGQAALDNASVGK